MKRIFLLLAALTGSLLLQARDYTLKSPDGAVVVTVQTGNHVS